jgi:Bacterial nucleoid DNA-binding protein
MVRVFLQRRVIVTKEEFVGLMATHAGISKKDSEKALHGFKQAITEVLRSSGRQAIPGLGVFTVAERVARKGHNPRTGAEIDIPAKRAVKFKAAKDLQGLLS